MSAVLPDLPDFFYKYLPYDDGTENAIRSSTIKFSAPGSFNDPFDISIPLILEGSDEEWRRYLNRIVGERNRQLNPAERMMQVQRMMRSEAFRKLEPRSPAEIFPDVGVLCVSEIPLSILMWSHYADNHRGVCLRFRSSTPDHFFLRAQKVIYQPDFPTARVFDDDLTRMRAIALTKSNDWEYEREWRILEHELGPGIHPFPPDILDAIILGCRTSDQTKESVNDAVSALEPRPRVVYAKMAERHFRLDLSDAA